MEDKRFMKHRFAVDLKIGETVDDVFSVSEKSLGKKRDGESYLTMVLGDRSGSIRAVMWEGADRTASKIRDSAFVRVKGSVSEYQGRLQVVVKEAIPFPESEIDPEAFLPKTPRNIERMFARLVEIADTFQDTPLKRLLTAFFSDADLMAKFKRAPAAKRMHHAYVGGLLEHTLSMTLLAAAVAGHYSGIDRDLLLAGAVLHDIGKTEEFVYHHVIDYSSRGRLLGHIVIGMEMIEAKIQTVKGFPEERAVLLKHLVLSHHGSREYGSPEVPKTVEAVLLHYIDEIDSKVNGIRDFIEAEAPGEEWTSFHRILGRQFYRKKS